MDPQYKPYLFGVSHSIKNFSSVFTALMELHNELKQTRGFGLKRIGVELPPSAIRTQRGFENHDIAAFWVTFISSCKKNGFELIPLYSDKLSERMYQTAIEEIKRTGKTYVLRGSQTKQISTPHDMVVRYQLPLEMERTAMKEKPDVLIVGYTHSGFMRKDLKLPKKHFKWIKESGNSEQDRIRKQHILDEVREFRKLQNQLRSQRNSDANKKKDKKRARR